MATIGNGPSVAATASPVRSPTPPAMIAMTAGPDALGAGARRGRFSGIAMWSVPW